MLIRIQLSLLCLLVGCSLQVANGSNNEPLHQVVYNVASDIGSHSSSNLKRTLSSTGLAVNRVIGAVGSVLNFGVNEVGDIVGRTDNFVNKTLPEQTTKVKDSIGNTGEDLVVHGSNTVQRTFSTASTVVKTADGVQNEGFQEIGKYVEGVGDVGKTAVRTGGKVGSKLNSMTIGALDTTGDVVTNPGSYVMSGAGYVRDAGVAGVGYLKAGAQTGVDYLGSIASFWRRSP